MRVEVAKTFFDGCKCVSKFCVSAYGLCVKYICVALHMITCIYLHGQQSLWVPTRQKRTRRTTIAYAANDNSFPIEACVNNM